MASQNREIEACIFVKEFLQSSFMKMQFWERPKEGGCFAVPEVSFCDVFFTIWKPEVSFYHVFFIICQSEVSFYDVFFTICLSKMQFYNVLFTICISRIVFCDVFLKVRTLKSDI